MEESDVLSQLILKYSKQYLNKHPRGKGMWYPEDYLKYIKKTPKIQKNKDLTQENHKTWYDGYADPQYFDKVDTFTFQSKPDAKPSEALNAFLVGPTIADCSNAVLVIFYKALMDYIGPEEFDEIFEEFFVIKVIGYNEIDTDLMQFLNIDDDDVKNSGKIGRRPLNPGDHVHIGCVKWYANKHPAGSGGGWNLIYKGDNDKGEQLFLAHGFTRPKTESQIYSQCFRDYNLERTEMDNYIIQKLNKPNEYNRSHNKDLTNYYKIAKKEILDQPDKFLKGYLPHTRTRLGAQ